jgi:hypothetical protein
MPPGMEYRRAGDPPRPVGPPYGHTPPVQSNGQAYGYNPVPHPSMAMSTSRNSVPGDLLVASQGEGHTAGLPPPGSMAGSGLMKEQGFIKQEQEPPFHSAVELGRRYRFVLHALLLQLPHPLGLLHRMIMMVRNYNDIANTPLHTRLDVVQQPKRARMCGFGDKDRRPITPPPCIRLIITDAATGMEIDPNEIDFSMFVLNVDLWSADGTKEVNLVRHTNSNSQPSPSLAQAHSSGFVGALGGYKQEPYSPQDQRGYYAQQQHPYDQHQHQHANHSAGGYAAHPPPPPPGAYGQGAYGAPPPYANRPPSPASYGHPAQQQSHGGYYPTPQPGPGGPDGMYPSPLATAQLPMPMPMPSAAMPSAMPTATGMFTRNLIGSLSASAFRLTDPMDKIGVWFVLQDLSVRTEGMFR